MTLAECPVCRANPVRRANAATCSAAECRAAYEAARQRVARARRAGEVVTIADAVADLRPTTAPIDVPTFRDRQGRIQRRDILRSSRTDDASLFDESVPSLLVATNDDREPSLSLSPPDTAEPWPAMLPDNGAHLSGADRVAYLVMHYDELDRRTATLDLVSDRRAASLARRRVRDNLKRAGRLEADAFHGVPVALAPRQRYARRASADTSYLRIAPSNDDEVHLGNDALVTADVVAARLGVCDTRPALSGRALDEALSVGDDTTASLAVELGKRANLMRHGTVVELASDTSLDLAIAAADARFSSSFDHPPGTSALLNAPLVEGWLDESRTRPAVDLSNVAIDEDYAYSAHVTPARPDWAARHAHANRVAREVAARLPRRTRAPRDRGPWRPAVDLPSPVHLTYDRVGLLLPQSVTVAAKITAVGPIVSRPVARAVEVSVWAELVTALSHSAGLVESAARPLSPVERYAATLTPSARVPFDHAHPLGTINMAWSISPRPYPVASSCSFDPDGRTSARIRKILPPGLGVPGSARVVRARGLVPIVEGWRATLNAQQGKGTWSRADSLAAMRAADAAAKAADKANRPTTK